MSTDDNNHREMSDLDLAREIKALPSQMQPERDLLINLSDDLPPSIDAFPRVAELVTSDDETRVRGRQRFTEYRNQGHELETHKV